MVRRPSFLPCSSSSSQLTRNTTRRKRQTGKNAKSAKDENTKELFENGEWARNDVTTERVGSSVLMYSFIKDGQVVFFVFF